MQHMTSAVDMETKYRLDTAAMATLDGAGSGQHTNVGPTMPGERWEISILGANGPSSSKLYVIRGNSFDLSRQLDFTERADGDTSPTNIELMPGEHISFWWLNGTAGAVMRCSITGNRFVPGNRAY